MTATRTRRAVGYRFHLEVDDDELARYLDELFVGLLATDDGVAGVEWKVARAADGRWAFAVGDDEVRLADSPEALVGTIVQTLNTEVTRAWSGPVCHAGGVSVDGRAVLLPADPESGKSTLTAGLVRAGFAYVSDEGVAFVAGTTHIEPYAKPLTLDPGSWELFPELEPVADFATDAYRRDQWQVPPTAFRPDAVSGPCDARFVVFPKYVEGARTELMPVSRAEALVELAKNTFRFNTRSRAALQELDPVVRACACHRLVVGDLDTAVACVAELVSGD
jgi:hypothetical protein